jgi:phage terminase Nu1 subunit (DNA packaging protein)
MIVNRNQLADIMGVSINTITNYLTEGMPYRERPGGANREWVLDSGPCVKWLVGRAKGDKTPSGNTLGDAKTRRLMAEAKLKELQLQEKLGELISVEDATRLAAEDYAVVKSRLRAIPRNLAQLLTPEQRVSLTEEIDSALKHLSSSD